MNTQYGPSDGIRTHSTKKNIVALLAWGASYCSLFFFSYASLYPPPAAVGSVTWSLTSVRSGKEVACPDPVPKIQQINKKSPDTERYQGIFGPSDGIRTHDLLVPNQAHYQTVPHPDICFTKPYNYIKTFSLCQLFLCTDI